MQPLLKTDRWKMQISLSDFIFSVDSSNRGVTEAAQRCLISKRVSIHILHHQLSTGNHLVFASIGVVRFLRHFQLLTGTGSLRLISVCQIHIQIQTELSVHTLISFGGPFSQSSTELMSEFSAGQKCTVCLHWQQVVQSLWGLSKILKITFVVN